MMGWPIGLRRSVLIAEMMRLAGLGTTHKFEDALQHRNFRPRTERPSGEISESYQALLFYESGP